MKKKKKKVELFKFTFTYFSPSFKGRFLIRSSLAFLRCVTVRPFSSHPNRYWDYSTEKIGNKNKFIALWNIAQKTKSKLILVNYEDSREQFKIIEVKGLSELRKIYEEIITKMNFDEFKIWFNDLISKSF